MQCLKCGWRNRLAKGEAEDEKCWQCDHRLFYTEEEIENGEDIKDEEDSDRGSEAELPERSDIRGAEGI